MSSLVSRIHWYDVLVAVVIWAGFFGQLVVLNMVFPFTVADCQSEAIFGCSDFTALWWDLASIPVWYGLWVFALRRLGSPWPWTTPLMMTAAAWVLGIRLPFDRLGAEYAVLGPVTALVALSAAWSVLVGGRGEVRD